MARARKELGVDFEVVWHPFFLDPYAKDRPGMDGKRESYREKGMDVEKIEKGMARLFAREGLDSFSLDGPVGNTMDSHRLAAWTFSKHGAKVQDRLVEAMFRRYFCASLSPSDLDGFLVASAEEVGLDGMAARELLMSEDGKKHLAGQYNELVKSGAIPGVPHFFMTTAPTEATPQGVTTHFGGAQEAESFFEIITSLTEKARDLPQSRRVLSQEQPSRL